MKRGYAVVGLTNPEFAKNVGSAMRACGVYGASALFYSGRRFRKEREFVTDPAKHWRHVPMFHVNDLHNVVPFKCVPVAVDLIEGAIPLHKYVHPERAFYIFGPEDGTLGEYTTSRCRDIISVPTSGCMNLAATVNVVLYDRLAKQLLKGDENGE